MRNKFAPTTFPELNEGLREFASSAIDILERNFLGVYLQGSFAIGGYDRHNDVDFIIVTLTELSAKEVELLQWMHACIFNPWVKHLDGSYFPLDILRATPRSRKKLWYLDNGSCELVKSVHCNTLVVRWVLREHGIVLAGPAPEMLIKPIQADKLKGEIRVVISDWGAEILQDPERFNNRFYQSFIVLSYCRMLHDLQSGSISSKRNCAKWAKTNLDPKWRGVIDRTWDARPNPEVTIRQPADPSDYERTLEFVQFAIDKSKQYPDPEPQSK
jgi:predicted nucleotidyltransferase